MREQAANYIFTQGSLSTASIIYSVMSCIPPSLLLFEVIASGHPSLLLSTPLSPSSLTNVTTHDMETHDVIRCDHLSWLTSLHWQVDGASHVVHSEEEALGTRLTIDSLTCLLANETDPSRLVAVSPGRLVRLLVEDGGFVAKDQPYAEIEVTIPTVSIISHSLPFFVQPDCWHCRIL